MKTVFYNGLVFTRDAFIPNSLVEVTGNQVTAIGEGQPAGDELIDLNGGYLVPAFIDIQIYGGNGQLFGEQPSVQALQATYDYCVAGGATHFLPTVATNSTEVMHAAIEAVRAYWKSGLPGVLGLHLEGPFINPAKRGAHALQFIKNPTLPDVQELMRKGEGVIKMMTLAPENCDADVINFLQEQSVIVSAGHTDASFEQANKAFANGINAATHLFNAMSPLQHRAPGMAGAILNHPHVYASMVADGHHVDYAVISIVKKIMEERLFLITDAVTENSSGIYQHRLQGDRYVVDDGTLSGSALTMLKAVRNCIDHVGLSIEESLRMASLYPARVLKIDDRLGYINKGYQAELLWLDEKLELKAVYTNGSLLRFGA